MGKKNHITKNYIRRADIFADIVNYQLFHGRQRIRPEDLQEKDITELLAAYPDITEIVSKEKLRDILKSCILKSTDGYDILIIGIESQSDIHYAMPVRNLVYDAINYASQAEEIARKHRKNRDLRNEEFLSGFSRKDRLVPVITITVYLGSHTWDAPRSLHEMFEVQDTSILQYVDNYHLNLLTPDEIENYDDFHTQFGRVMQFIAASNDRQKLSQVLADERFQRIERDAAAVLEVCTDIKIPRQQEVEGGINMCKAWEDQYMIGRSEGQEDGRKEGRKEGRLEGIEEAKITIFQNMIRRGFQMEEARTLAELSEEQAKKILSEMK